MNPNSYRTPQTAVITRISIAMCRDFTTSAALWNATYHNHQWTRGLGSRAWLLHHQAVLGGAAERSLCSDGPSLSSSNFLCDPGKVA